MKRFKLRTIILIGEIGIFFLLIFLFIINYKTLQTTLYDIEKTKVQKILQSNLDTIATLYRINFKNDLKEVIDSILKNNPNIKKITITNEPLPHYLSFPLHYKNKVIGYLNVDFNYQESQEILSRYKKDSTIFIITFFTILLLSFILINKRLKAIYLLAQKIKDINLFKLTKIPPLDRYEEIEQIVSAINYFITTIKETLQKLKTTQKHLQEAQKIAKLSSWEYYPKSEKFFATPQLYRILHHNKNEPLDWNGFLSFFDPQGRKKFLREIELLQKRNNRKSVEIISKLHTPQGQRYIKSIIKKQLRHHSLKLIAISMDITEEMRAKQEVEYLAFHDALTGFYNRHALSKQLEIFSNFATRENKKYALFYLDIDDFKFINDTYGHHIGDKVLIELSRKLKKLIRSSDMIFRIGGDEFLILFYDIKDKQNILILAKKILKIFNNPFQIDNLSLQVKCSLGIALYPSHSRQTQELIQYADVAMYEAKRSGKNTFKIFDESMHKSLVKSQDILEDLKKALLEETQLQLYIQPKIELRTKKIKGGEILIRWFHPARGAISPGEFIPLAEESNLILEIDRYVLQRSFEIIYEWQQRGLRDITIAINLSTKQFQNPLFDEMVESLLQKYPINTTMVEFEVTESASMQDIAQSIEVLNRLKSLGFSIAIDDFGTGYSSLSYIKRLPFDSLKIDRSFVQDIHKDKDDRAITELIIKIAKVLQKETIAEGVENRVHEELLRGLSCTYAQGFLYYKPIPLKEFEKLLPIDNHIDL